MRRWKEKISTEDIDLEQFLKDLEAERRKIEQQANKYKHKLEELRKRWLFLTERGQEVKKTIRVLRERIKAKAEGEN